MTKDMNKVTILHKIALKNGTRLKRSNEPAQMIV